ncbi:hypothetical protein SDC9_143207 [bioreactor metagenome]|uniref:Uncharacterized protein n=1 Tax=bioreactor metagenome TaxID=1076179 RepID=A0A645E3B6_9ZZZZ
MTEVRKETAGVEITPRRCALPPAAQMPAAKADSSIVPDNLVSLPIIIFGAAVSLPKYSAAALPSLKAISGVNSAFATPLTPSVPNKRPIP